MNQFILDFLIKYKRTILEVILVLILVCGLVYHLEAVHQAKMEKAVLISQQQLEKIDTLQKLLDENKQNATMTQAAILKGQAGQIQPVTHFTVTAPSLPVAAQDVQARINKQDTTLPPMALQKTDRTLVVQQPDNKQYSVGVYKVNNYRNWEWSTGIGVHNGDVYIPVELQRNYSKDHAIAAEVHVSTSGKINGGEVKYTVMTDKLF